MRIIIAMASLVVAVGASAAAGTASVRTAQATRTEPAELRCPSVLGTGLKTARVFCDVLIQREPADGVVVVVPPHRGEAQLWFTLHNRHTYSEDEVRAGRAYAQYTTVVNVVTMDRTLLGRGVVQNEFRTASDLVDRLGGGAGPDGVKAVAPTGGERVLVNVPMDVKEIVIVGERLEVVRAERRDLFVTPGRPIAVVSDIQITYRPRR